SYILMLELLCTFILTFTKSCSIKNINTFFIEETYIKTDEVLKYVINYLYWCHDISFNKLKMTLGINRKETLSSWIDPVTVNYECPLCRKTGLLTKLNSHSNQMSFICKYCNHKENNFESYSVINCNCSICDNIKREVFIKLKQEFMSYLEKTKLSIIDYINSTRNYYINENKFISDDKMKQDHDYYYSIITRDELELLSLKPKNFDELTNYVIKLNEKILGKRAKNYMKELLNNLKSHGIIYPYNNIRDWSPTIEAATKVIIINSLEDFNYKTAAELFNTFYTTITGKDFTKFYRLFYLPVEFRTSNFNLTFKNIPNATINFCRNINIYKYSCIEKTYTLNPNFFLNTRSISPKTNIVPSNTKNIFINCDKNIFISLKNLYANYIVIPKQNSSYYIYNTDGRLESIAILQKSINNKENTEKIIKDSLIELCFEYFYLNIHATNTLDINNYIYNLTIINNLITFSLKDCFNKINLFNSPAEINLYSILKNSPDFIVIPNAKLATIMYINKFVSLFTEKDFMYLQKCIVDFCIYDLNGNVIKVIEVQKGCHHNQIDWIIKDNLKRSICNEAGVELVEYF
ncbi:hypothetical protein, partial [Clostridium sp. C8-1-8]|uniref:hypothetical protein n=1 Tax=Clostridium sp. C8-1-8 TaxID=2698831 RepID=UPI001A9B1749